MRLPHGTAETVAYSENSAPVLHGRWLVLGRAGWAALVLLNLSLFAASIRALYARRGVLPEDVLAGLARLGIPEGLYAMYVTALFASFGLGCFVVATMIAWHRSTDPMALFVSLFLVLLGGANHPNVKALAAAYPAFDPLLTFLWGLLIASLSLSVFLFPDGRFVPRWMRVPSGLLILGTFVALFFGGGSLAEPPYVLGPIVIAALLTGTAAQIYRYRRVSSLEGRQQTKWVVFGIAAAAVGQVAGFLFGPLLARTGLPVPLYSVVDMTVITLAYFLIPLSIGIAILRYRLWDIDLIINRALVYGTLTASVVGLYVLVVGYLGALLQLRDNLLVSLLATGLIAVLFAPLHDRLQRGVNRMMYGERDEPYAVLSRLGQRLEATLSPDAALRTIVETVAHALKLPYVAITLSRDGEFRTAAEYGALPDETIVLPLAYQTEPVGQLILAPRAPGDIFSASDKRLLEDLARQAGVAAQALRLTADLQRSRERLVTAREEERRRLRRDLHDGLGPQLAAQTLKVGSARSLYAHDPTAADALLAELEADMEAALADIRRLVYALRPPALDELGLVGAIRESATQYGTHRLSISLNVPERMPPLPAAVEVAAYRIAQEALTNVARHAQASCCLVRLSLDDRALKLEIADDGVGLPPNRPAGVGLTSMRERAAELGGTCAIETIPNGGTRVLVRLPLSNDENTEKE